jgi:hypothetical protein
MRKTLKYREKKNRTRKGGMNSPKINRPTIIHPNNTPVGIHPNVWKMIIKRKQLKPAKSLPTNDKSFFSPTQPEGFKGGVKLHNPFKRFFTKRKNIISQKPSNNSLVNSTPKPILSGNNNILITPNNSIVKKYPRNQVTNYVSGFRPPVFGPKRQPIVQPNWA